MWIVRLALRRPYTFVVLSLLLFIIGPVVMLRTPVDIFPNIDIPVVSVVWNYAGLSPEQLAQLQALTTDAPEVRAVTVGADGLARLDLPMRAYDVVLVEFRPEGG